MSGFTFNINQHYASLHFTNDTGEKRDGWLAKWSHYPILHRLLNFIRDRGFEVGRDPQIQKDYKCISKHHWYGKKGDLEFKAKRYPRGFEIQFFQNAAFENRHGGYYDFDKYEKMPYLIKLMFRNEMWHIKQFLEQLGCIDTSKPVYKTAEDIIKHNYVESWHHPQKTISEFELKDLHGLTPELAYNNTDRGGKTIYSGQIKYFRDTSTGRLMRGTVYHNINNMWWVILNKTDYTNVASFHLFDANEADLNIRRKKAGGKPREFLQKQEKLRQASTKELINELKRRGLKVSA